MNFNRGLKLAEILFSGLALMLIGSGCMSPGGLNVGPLSALATTHIEHRMKQREDAAYSKVLLGSKTVTEKQKQEFFRAVQIGVRPGEFAVAIGFDIFSIPETKMSVFEIGENFVSVAGDGVLYGLVYKGTDKLLSGGSSSPSMTFNGPVQNSSIQSASPNATQHYAPDNSYQGGK